MIYTYLHSNIYIYIHRHTLYIVSLCIIYMYTSGYWSQNWKTLHQHIQPFTLIELLMLGVRLNYWGARIRFKVSLNLKSVHRSWLGNAKMNIQKGSRLRNAHRNRKSLKYVQTESGIGVPTMVPQNRPFLQNESMQIWRFWKMGVFLVIHNIYI